MESPKVIVSVNARFAKDGKVLPLSIAWENGCIYEIDEVKDIRHAASLRAGGAGMRYTVRIGRSTTFLFREQDQWFVERK